MIYICSVLRINNSSAECCITNYLGCKYHLGLVFKDKQLAFNIYNVRYDDILVKHQVWCGS